MGKAEPAKPAKLVCGILSQHGKVGADAEAALETLYGPTDLRSDRRPFTESCYYEPEMGADLERWWVSFKRLVTAGDISSIKVATNAIERDLAGTAGRRRVNLDPGYVVPSRLVLATTKDYTHRIYLSEGIYGEVTLVWQSGRFVPMDWTYPDYRSEEAGVFFATVRKRLMEQLSSSCTDVSSAEKEN